MFDQKNRLSVALIFRQWWLTFLCYPINPNTGTNNYMSKEYFDKENFEKILMSRKNVVKFSDGEVCLWIEAESCVMLRAITKCGDPV
jgi:hypothetical protein